MEHCFGDFFFFSFLTSPYKNRTSLGIYKSPAPGSVRRLQVEKPRGTSFGCSGLDCLSPRPLRGLSSHLRAAEHLQGALPVGDVLPLEPGAIVEEVAR